MVEYTRDNEIVFRLRRRAAWSATSFHLENGEVLLKAPGGYTIRWFLSGDHLCVENRSQHETQFPNRLFIIGTDQLLPERAAAIEEHTWRDGVLLIDGPVYLVFAKNYDDFIEIFVDSIHRSDDDVTIYINYRTDAPRAGYDVDQYHDEPIDIEELQRKIDDTERRILAARDRHSEMVKALLAIPEPLPSQEIGPQFEIRDNVIELADLRSQEGFGQREELETWRPLVRDALEDLLGATPVVAGQTNDPFKRMRTYAAQYLAALSQPLEAIDYGRLFGIGNFLQNRLASDIEGKDDGDLPPLSGGQRAALRDFQSHHGPFITASKAGMQGLRTAEFVERSVPEERKFAGALRELVEDVGSITGVASEETLEALSDAAGETGRGKFAERTVVYGRSAARNFIIVLCAYASVGVVAAAGGLAGGPLGALATGGALYQIVHEATKKSAAFKELTDPLTGWMDQVKAIKLRDFVRQHRNLLNQIAGDRPEMEWLRKYLDWLADDNDPPETPKL